MIALQSTPRGRAPKLWCPDDASRDLQNASLTAVGANCTSRADCSASAGFAPAYANLGRTYLSLGALDQMRRHDAYAMAEQLSEKAIGLENTPEMRLHLAAVRANTRNDWDTASRAVDEALAIAANDPRIYTIRAQMRSFRAQHDGAVADWKKAIELEPLCRPGCEVWLANFYPWARRNAMPGGRKMEPRPSQPAGQYHAFRLPGEGRSTAREGARIH
jgi:tetratricopeptide (TPR) repeat protein